MMWLVRMHYPRVVLQLGREVEARMPGRNEHVPERTLAVELEAAVDSPNPIDAAQPQAPVPADALPQLLHVAEEVGDRRAVAVTCACEERPRRAPPECLTDCEARKGRGSAVAIAFRAHALLADRARPAPPRGCGILVG
jgi:hypothetical protein